MDLKEIMTITEMPGIYKVLAKRNDGVIVLGLHDDSRKFVPSRKHMFTPLENITIYTTEDPVELKVVLSSMRDMKAQFPIPDSKLPESELRAYLKEILPTYDEEKVYISDIRKLVKWYSLLEKHDLLKEAELPAEDSTTLTVESSQELVNEEQVAETLEVVEEVVKPKKAASKKTKPVVEEEATNEKSEDKEVSEKPKKSKKKAE